MYPNLNAEMARKCVSVKSLCDTLGKCEKTIRNKVSGNTPFTISEAKLIAETFFCGMTIDYLFAKSDEDINVAENGS